ncbi:hypothetical protein MBLNU230_g5076t1 [Neophaeotheca triangularis]
MSDTPTAEGQKDSNMHGTPSHKPTFDASKLLNPKGASKPSTSSPVQDEQQGTEAQSSGMGSMIETMNGLTARSDAPIKKRNIDDVDGAEEQQKPKSKFSGAANSGILSQEVKKQKSKAADVVDLTGDNNRSVALDDAAITHNKANQGSSRVVLGMVELQTNAHKLPSVSAQSDNKSKEAYWKPTQVTLFHDKKSPGGKTVYVLDRMKERFARIMLHHVQAFLPMLLGQHIMQFNYKTFLPARPRKPGQAVGQATSERMVLHLVLDAPRDRAPNIGKRLKELGLVLIDPRYSLGPMEYLNPQWPRDAQFTRKATMPSSASVSSTSRAQDTTRTAEQMQHDVNTIFQNLDQYETLPEIDASPMIVGKLFPHQKQALFYMTKHEQSHESFKRADGLSDFSLWKPVHKAHGDVYINAITAQEIPVKPSATRGGLLADQMGMGKTLSIISLVCHSLDDAVKFSTRKASPMMAQTVCTTRATLVVCPVSLIEVWKDQIHRYTGGKLKVLDYRGNSRDRDPHSVRKFDVVITSYNLVSLEWRSGEESNTLGSVEWFRVVLDEAHEIRNPTTALAKSCCALSTQRRWAVTGTPTQNKLEDLGTLIRFLRVQPFDEQRNWTTYIDNKLKAGEQKAYQNLQLLVESITLRRTKDKMEQPLPDCVEEIVRLPFTDEERQLYSKVLDKTTSKLRPILDGQKVGGKQFLNMFTIILQLRMICDHGREMMGEKEMQALEDGNDDVDIDLGDEQPDGQQTVSERAAYEHFATMEESGENGCRICNRTIEEPEELDDNDDSDVTVGFITNCVDLLCPDCTKDYTAATKASLDGYAKCPFCNAYGLCGMVELCASGFKRTRLERERAEEFKQKNIKWTPESYSGPHSKVKQLIKDLKASAKESAALPKGEAPIRSVVFSGWVQMLDLVAYALKLEGIQYCRIDGKMSSTQRGEEVASFNKDPSKRIFLISIKAGGQGLNLEAANKVYMLEPQYNPGAEEQAFQRVHRIGQQRPVVIKRYVMEDSVEEGVLRLQKKKKEIGSMSMERRSKFAQNERKREELKMIFQ